MKNDNTSSDVGEVFELAYLDSDMQDYRDDSFVFLNRTNLKPAERNEYYREMKEWESAPILRIDEWVGPRWTPLAPDDLSDAEVSRELLKTATRLYSLNQAIQCADHLSDRRLYRLILSGVLPFQMKRLPNAKRFSVWNFCAFLENCRDESLEELVWLTYYASEEERQNWREKNDDFPPEKLEPKYKRDFFPFNVKLDFTR